MKNGRVFVFYNNKEEGGGGVKIKSKHEKNVRLKCEKLQF